MDKLELVRNFLETQVRMVIATSSKENKPEAALVRFAYADDLSLVFGTSTITRKYINIQDNPTVAIVFGNREKITVQYEGTVSSLVGEELNKYKEIYFKKSPSSKKYENQENQIYLKVKPFWIRYTDYTGYPNEIFEIDL